MAENATIVAASLDSSQLEQSINKLVSMVAEKTKAMANNFTKEVGRMEQAVKNLGNIKIDSGGTADGGSSRRTSKQKEEESQVKATTQAYKEQKSVVGELAMSFDNLNTAITKSNSKLAAKFDVTEQQKVQQLEAQRTAIEDKIVARQIEIDESYRSQLATLSKTRSELESKANLTSKEQADLKHVTTEWERINKIVRDISSRPIVAADDTTGSIGRLQQQLVETNKQLEESRKRIQEMNFERAKMYDGSLSGLIQNAQATMKYQNDTLKKSFEDLLKKPTHDVDEMRAKMERLQTFLNNIKPLNIFSPELITNGERAINKLKNEIQKFNDKPTKQAFADALKLPDRTQSEIITKINRIRDAIKSVEGTKIVSETEIARAKSLIDSLRDKWDKLYNAPKDRKLRIDFADTLKMPTNNIDEIAAKLMRLQWILQEMRGMQILSPDKIATGNQQISVLLSKLEAEMSIRQQINAVEQADMQNAQKRIELEAKYGEEVAKAAAIANEWLQKNKEAAILNKEGTFVIQDPKAGQTVGQSIEAQLLAYKAINGELNLELEVQKAIQNTVESIERAEQRRIALTQGGNATSNKSFADYEDLRTAIAAVLRVRESEVSLANSEDASYKALSLTLKQLKQAYESLDASQRKSENADALIASIHETQRAMQEIQNQMSRPVNLANVLALPEKNIDDISYKVQMLRAYAQGINIETNAGNAELRRVMSTIEGLNEGLKNAQKTTKQITIESNNIKFDNIAKMPTESLKQVGAKIKEVKQYINELKNQPIVDEKNLKRAEALYDRLIKQSQKLNDTKGTHSNVNDALNVRVKTLDEIAKKMQRLQAIRQNLDINKQKADIDRINAALGELKKQQDEVLQRNANMIKSNNALGRSWNYMKNRLAFYFTVGASTQFVKNLIDIRSQYEMNERALGILINSAERGTQIFNELSQMALVSPYTLIELSAAAKQLTAYDIAARDVVDTTRRLADMASAVGVPIDRLTYALGQIKAYGYLNSRDARMFANAGIPLVKQLSDYYTELEGKMVSTADVYDRMKKKAIDYNSVMSVITKMTDEGGKFFDFQAKMADTLKVRLANLTLAWNNMLNEIGKESQGTLTWGIGALRELFLHWKVFSDELNNVATVAGVIKALQLLGIVLHSAGVEFYALNKYMTVNALLGTRLAGVVRTIGSAFMTLVHSPLAWLATVALFAYEITDAFVNADKATKEFNESLRQGAKTTYEDLAKFAEQYKNIRDSLYTTETFKDNKGNIVTTTLPQNIEEGEAKKVWEAMREQIELSSHASDEYISKLLSIENVSERLRQGFQILDDIQTVSAALKDIGDDGIKVEKGWAAWWNAWQGADGLIQNVKDLQEEIGRLKNEGVDTSDKLLKTIDKDYGKALERLQKDLKTTTDSILDFINLNGWSGDTGKINETFKQITDKLIQQGGLNPQEAFTLQLEMETARSQAAKNALDTRIADEKKALESAADENSKMQIQKNLETLEQQKRDFDKFNGENRVYWDDFTKYIKERHVSELRAAYNSMTDNGKKAMDFQSERWQKYVHDWANGYEKSHNLATDSVFNRLRNWINDANTWSVFIKMTISNEDEKPLVKQLEELDKAADDAWKKMQRLDKRIAQLRKKGAHEIEGEVAGGILDSTQTRQDDKELTQAIKERTQAQADYNKAIANGAESKKADAAASKAQKQAESELAKALKDELKLIETVRSAYKDLTKDGASHNDAVEKSVSGYEKSVANINAVLNKYGIGLDLSKFAGISNPHELQKMLREQLNALVGKAKPTEIQALEVEIKKVNLDVEKYDLTKITKGLNNELDRLKDEYELAVSLDADPELGSMFADWMGIDMDSLPRTAQEYAKRYTDILNSKLKEYKANIVLPNLLTITDKDLRDYQDSVGTGGITQKYVDDITKGVKAVRDIFKKEKEDTSRDWNALIEKYGGLQAKLLKIYKDNVQQQASIVREFGTNDEQIKALDIISKIKISQDPAEVARLQKELALVMNDVTSRNPVALKTYQATQKEQSSLTSKAMWDDFKDSDLYSMTFTDMANNSTQAIQLIIDKLNELKDKVKEDPASMKALIKSLEDAEKELNARDPFAGIVNSIKNWSAASKEAKVAQEELRDAEKAVANAQSELDDAEDGTPEEQALAQKNLTDAIQRRGNAEVKVVQAENKVKKSQEQLNTSLTGLSNTLNEIGGLFGTVAKLFAAAGDDDTAEAINAISEGFSTMTTVIMGVVAAMMLLEATNPWLLAISAALGVIVGLVSFLSGNRNKGITKKVEESERAVKRLELAYVDLQQAVDKAYGTAVIGAKQATLANKELQLAEIQRQIQLEKSRSSKNRDEDKIIDLQKQYKELFYEIRNGYTEIVDDLMGTDVGSFAENLVSSMIDAFKQGEDYMQVFSDKFDEMIDNMIMKSIVSRVVSQYLDAIWEDVDKHINDRTEKEREDAAKAQNEAVRRASLSDDEVRMELVKQRGDIWSMSKITQKDIDDYRKAALAEEKSMQARLDAASAFTGSDVDYVMQRVTEVMPELGQKLKDILGEYYKYGESSETQLSALQQGISQISEQTAGALEAYANSISQQAYLRNDLLVQIRDTIMSFDMDVQLGVFSQMLLQLQNNYIVMQSMQSIMEGWTTPSGQGIRVELIS